jgi:hypothetical protein
MTDSTADNIGVNSGSLGSRVKPVGRFSLFVGLVLAAVSVGSAYLAYPTTGPQGPLAADVTIRDMGVVRQGAVLQTSFELTNRGSKVIELLEATKSCTCTSAKLEKSQLAPGESSRLNVEIMVGANRGDLTSRLGVVFADVSKATREPQLLNLVVQTIVSPDVECDPQMLTFQRSSRAPRTVRIYSKWINEPLILRVQAGHRAFRARPLADGKSVEVSFDPTLWPRDEDPLTDLVVTTPSKPQPGLRIPIRVVEDDKGT